ncbi:MAG: sugar ABC transporter ATP-binding protein, partial [Methylocella sp.]
MTNAERDPRAGLSEASPVVELRGISKSFGATRAVAGVDLALFPGEVHGLVGENGAGKSTLMRILAGFFPDHGGTILLDGRVEELASPAQARAHGIVLVHQELSLLPELSVAENILLGREPPARLRLFISRRETMERARLHLKACGVGLDAGTRVARLSIAERQLVEIVKGVAALPRVLILDEPTSSLSTRETRDLFGVLQTLRMRRTAMVYISHKLDEIFATCQRATVLRDGRKVAAASIEDWTEASLVRAMVGRDLSQLFPRTFGTTGEIRLEVAGLARPGRFESLSFTIRSGEIVGLYGMIGAGRTAVAEALFGLAPAQRGT